MTIQLFASVKALSFSKYFFIVFLCELCVFARDFFGSGLSGLGLHRKFYDDFCAFGIIILDANKTAVIDHDSIDDGKT